MEELFRFSKCQQSAKLELESISVLIKWLVKSETMNGLGAQWGDTIPFQWLWLWHFWGMCNDIMTGLVWDNHSPVIVMTYDSGLSQTNDSCHEHQSVCSRLVGFNLKIRKAPATKYCVSLVESVKMGASGASSFQKRWLLLFLQLSNLNFTG